MDGAHERAVAAVLWGAAAEEHTGGGARRRAAAGVLRGGSAACAVAQGQSKGACARHKRGLGSGSSSVARGGGAAHRERRDDEARGVAQVLVPVLQHAAHHAHADGLLHVQALAGHVLPRLRAGGGRGGAWWGAAHVCARQFCPYPTSSRRARKCRSAATQRNTLHFMLQTTPSSRMHEYTHFCPHPHAHTHTRAHTHTHMFTRTHTHKKLHKSTHTHAGLPVGSELCLPPKVAHILHAVARQLSHHLQQQGSRRAAHTR